MRLEKILNKLLLEVQKSTALDEETKENLTDLIISVKLDPTPANLAVLGAVLKKWGEFEQYVGSLTISSDIEAKQQQATT